MPVIIDEFEVMPGQASANQEGTTPAHDASDKTAPSAREICLLLEQQAERAERVWAH